MRPRGEISLTIEQCLRHQGAATFEEVAGRTKVGRLAARCTLHNMLRTGRVEVVDTRRSPRCRRPMNVYQVRNSDDEAARSANALIDAMRSFCAAA